MAGTTRISALAAILAAAITATSVLPITTDVASPTLVTNKITMAQMRTAILGGGTGYTDSDPLTVGAVTATSVTASASTAFSATGQTTGQVHGILNNSGGNLVWGIESSAGGVLFVGSAAYAGVLGMDSAQALQFATNNTVRVTIASSGAVTMTSGLTVSAGGITVSAGTLAAQSVTSTGIVISVAANQTAQLVLNAPTAGYGSTIAMQNGGVTKWSFGLNAVSASNNWEIYNAVTASTALTINTATNALTVNNTIKANAGDLIGGAGAWQLGKLITGAVTLDTSHYVEVWIDGSQRKLLVAN